MLSYRILGCLLLCSVAFLSFQQLNDQQPDQKKLSGMWIRETDVSEKSQSGVIVYVEMRAGKGTIKTVPEKCCFGLGDTKWRNIKYLGDGVYSLEELWRYHTCESAGYYLTELKFINDEKIMLSGGGYTTYWIRPPHLPMV